MAIWRPQQVLPLVPPELRDFDPRRWPDPQAWSDARFEWLLERPDRDIDGMDIVQVLFEID
jgi:hypothetical protein